MRLTNIIPKKEVGRFDRAFKGWLFNDSIFGVLRLQEEEVLRQAFNVVSPIARALRCDGIVWKASRTGDG